MTAGLNRPGLYGFHAKNIVTSLPTVSDGIGYVASSIADPDVANALGKAAGFWQQYCDATSFKLEDCLDGSAITLSRAESLEYPTGAGLTGLVPTQTPAVIVDGCRVTFDESIIALSGLNPASFAASSRTWFYGKAAALPGDYASIRADVVALGTGPTPMSGEAVLGAVDTDGTDVTANIPSTLSSTVTWDARVEFTGSFTAGIVTLGDVTCGDIVCGDVTGEDIACDTVTVAGNIGVSLDVTGDNSNPAVDVSNGDATGLALTVGDARGISVVSSSALLPSILVTNSGGGDGLVCQSPATFNSGVALGNAPADPILVSGTATFVEQVTLGGGAVAATQTITALTLEGLTIDTGSSGVAEVNRIDWYTDATPTSAPGEQQWDGFRLSIGDGTTAWPIAAPRRVYVASDTTVNPIDDISGALITLTIEPTQQVLITLDVHQEVNATQDPQIRLEADNGTDNVPILKGGGGDQARSALPTTVTAGDRRPNSIEIVWQPTDDVPVPDNNNWTIQARHGVTGLATLTTTGVLLQIHYL